MVEYAAAIIGAASLAYGVYSGERQRGEAKDAMGRQKAAEDVAANAAGKAEREAERERARARRKTPDPAALLGDGRAQPGPSLGIPTGSLLLGNRFLGL